MAEDRRTGSRRRRRNRSETRPPRRRTQRWREIVDSFGGFLTIGAVGGAVVVVLVLVFSNPLGINVSDEPLMGEARPQTVRATHTDNVAEMVGQPGEPPTGGPHFPTPLRTGIYDDPIADGNAVHALEHGVVWITYNPDLVDSTVIEALEDVAGDFRRDVILSPRAQNEMAIAAVSWERILRLDALDEQLLQDFVVANRNRSPEPGIR